MTRPAEHVVKNGDGKFSCELCPHHCLIANGRSGRCKVREVSGGEFRLLTYGRCTALAGDPMEKKPLYHFLPAQQVLSFGSVGCNLTCDFCQNCEISQGTNALQRARNLSPEQIAEAAVSSGASAVAATYNEPVVFVEYAMDAAAECKKRGLKTVAVSNGMISDTAREDFYSRFDALNIDLKGMSQDFYKNIAGGYLEPVLETLRFAAKREDIWLEITTLVIPGLNDSREETDKLVKFIGEELGDQIPLHLSAYRPCHLSRRPATRAEDLLNLRSRMKKAGLRHVYCGNILDSEASTTFCSECNAELISRNGYRTLKKGIDETGKCQECQARLCGVFS